MASPIINLLRKSGVECYTRVQWDSPRQADGWYARRRGTHPMPSGPADYHFLHITVTGDTDLPREGKAAARQVESFGLSTPPMVSYQDLVTNEGRYFEGQNYGVKGTHTINDKNVPGFPHDLNLQGYACAIMQNVQDEVTDAQVDTIAKVFAARELLGLVKRGAPIYPHRKFDWKACPGDKAVARMDEIDRLRTKYVREGLVPQTAPTLRLVTFNVFVGQSGESLRNNLIELAKSTKRPHVIALQEAKNLHGSIPGYQRVSVKPTKDRPEANSCVLLIRGDVEILRERPVFVDGPDWIGPKQDRVHRPRVFIGATIKAEGRVWDVLCIHRVVGGRRRNKLAWLAEDRTLEAWSLQRRTAHPDRPVIIYGDQNARKFRLRGLAKRLTSRLALRGIDGAIHRNCDATAVDVAGRFGSDSHNPVLITATAHPKEK